ncbi:PqiC family protein [Marinomonas pollencensis]|uniref:ABC-type transport auxiliary lipoprotein component domain-containing protein n=1 Tax=Marinomonas pollencensis TaxID=491954 RepID=A0A3E0DS83_9GAMM|nr:PqiC family protein [Marinomonas pollencensis]REG84278.1 hypothetical protein DFP81_104157 [Marinomonas pollencensis]
MKSNTVKALMIGGLAWLLLGCANTPLTSSEYLLMDNTPKVVIDDARTEVNIQLLPIQVADYLAGSEIVLLSKQGEVYRSQQNLWAEPLSAQLNRLTMQGFMQRLPLTDWYRGNHSKMNDLLKLSIEVDAFYGDLEGRVHVSGRWTLFSASGQIMRDKSFMVSEKLAQSGYPKLVQTLAKTWFQKVLDPISKQVSEAL